MSEEPTHGDAEEPSSEAEEPSSEAEHPQTSDSSFGSSWLINDTWKPVRERIPSDHAARRLLAVLVVTTMCAATIILEVALLLRGAATAEVITGLTPLTALASAVATFFFAREK